MTTDDPRPALPVTDDIAAPAEPAPTPALDAGGESRQYHDFLRLGRSGWWRGALAIISFIAAYLIASTILSTVGLIIDMLTGRLTLDELAMGQFGLSPSLMLMNNLSLAAMLPVAMLLQWAFFGVRPGRLSSVTGRFRWRWFGRAALIILPLWIVYVAGSFLLAPLPGDLEFSADAIALLVIVLVSTPLQAAGEEYGARGLLNRSAASWAADPRVGFAIGAALSSVLFAIAHLAGDPWLIAYYLVFGVVLCAVSTATGGLEAAVLIHAANNVLLLVPTVLAGQQDEIFERGEGTGGPFMILPMAVLIVAGALVIWWSRRSKVETTGTLPPRPEPAPAAVAPA